MHSVSLRVEVAVGIGQIVLFVVHAHPEVAQFHHIARLEHILEFLLTIQLVVLLRVCSM